jgi:hypothetical protein
MFQTRMMPALATIAGLIYGSVRQLIPWLVAVAITAAALIALAEGYFA